MKKFNCSSCGAEVTFRSNTTVFLICSFCHSMLVRHDLNLENIGKMAELKEDFSPLQIGTTGRYDGQNFTVIGRICQSWQAGKWDEWYVLFDDQRNGWLGEAQGFFMMSFEQAGHSLPPLENLSPGTDISVGKQLFRVDDIKKARCLFAQGELPRKVVVGRECTSIDVSGPNNAFGTLDYSAEGTTLFLGKYVDFEQFSFSYLRELDGW